MLLFLLDRMMHLLKQVMAVTQLRQPWGWEEKVKMEERYEQNNRNQRMGRETQKQPNSSWVWDLPRFRLPGLDLDVRENQKRLKNFFFS